MHTRCWMSVAAAVAPTRSASTRGPARARRQRPSIMLDDVSHARRRARPVSQMGARAKWELVPMTGSVYCIAVFRILADLHKNSTGQERNVL